MNWLAPSLGYIATVGFLGITSKLALEHLTWQALVPWTAGAYLLTAGVLIAAGKANISWEAGSGWAAASAALAVASLILLFAALSAGEASKVVPITAAYPALTLMLAALFLAEHISVARTAGMLLVVGGVVLLTAAR